MIAIKGYQRQTAINVLQTYELWSSFIIDSLFLLYSSLFIRQQGGVHYGSGTAAHTTIQWRHSSRRASRQPADMQLRAAGGGHIRIRLSLLMYINLKNSLKTEHLWDQLQWTQYITVIDCTQCDINSYGTCISIIIYCITNIIKKPICCSDVVLRIRHIN